MTSVMGPTNHFGLLTASCLLLVSPIYAQSPITETQERLRLQAVALEVMVSEAIQQSDAMGRSNPSRAIALLREAKTRLEADNESLKPGRREELIRKVRLRMAVWTERSGAAISLPSSSNTAMERRDAEISRLLSAALPSRGSMDIVGKREEPDGKRIAGEDSAEARSRLFRQFVSENSRVIRELTRLSSQQCGESEKDRLSALLPPMNQLLYPTDWNQWISRRSPALLATDQEKAILAALDRPMSISIANKPFIEVLDHLRKQTGQSILVDERALYEFNMTYETAINLDLENVSTRTALKRLLSDLGLTYVMKNQAIQITSIGRAKSLLTRREYSAADLLAALNRGSRKEMTREATYFLLKLLVGMIPELIEPDSWEIQGKGGLGTIVFDPVAFAFFVEQSDEIHFRLSSSGTR